MAYQSGDISEIEQLRLLRAGQKQAFEFIYNRYSLPIYRKILRLVKIEHIATELTQEVFVRIWEKRHLIDPEDSFASYLYKIASNLVMDFFRKAARDKQLKSTLSLIAVNISDNADSHILHSENRHILHEAIRQLPAQQQSAFNLCKIDGLSHEEASHKLGISIATVNNHIVKANKAVRKYILRYFPLILALYLSA